VAARTEAYVGRSIPRVEDQRLLTGTGRYGDDFLWRAAAQSLGAIVANDPVEAVYLLSFSDVDGDAYSPQGRYEMHFPPGELPQVDAFWNLAVYTREDMNLIPNPIDRYSVGDRTEFALDADGALTIFLQPESPRDECRDPPRRERGNGANR